MTVQSIPVMFALHRSVRDVVQISSTYSAGCDRRIALCGVARTNLHRGPPVAKLFLSFLFSSCCVLSVLFAVCAPSIYSALLSIPRMSLLPATQRHGTGSQKRAPIGRLPRSRWSRGQSVHSVPTPVCLVSLLPRICHCPHCPQARTRGSGGEAEASRANSAGHDGKQQHGEQRAEHNEAEPTHHSAMHAL